LWIRTHATLLLQLSKPFFWQLQILASGAAQKVAKNLKYEEHCRGTYAKISKNSRVPKGQTSEPLSQSED